jgi:uncharacterized protein
MEAELIPVSFNKVMQTRSYTVVVLGTEEKNFAIYTDPGIGRAIQMHLTEIERPRPLTHDLLGMIFKGLNVKVKQVVINDIQDTVYFARLFLEQENEDMKNILEIDARPSDCITLALMHDVPVYCTREVLEKAVPVEE